jgi:hypothetical protein
MTGIRALAVMLVAASVTGLAACGGDPEPNADAAGQPAASAASAAGGSATEDWGDPPAASVGGSSAPACDLPVTFDVAAKWVPKPVSAEVAEAFGGPDRVACEIDAKPAGILGFVRVYLAPQADPRAALQARAAAAPQAADQRFRQITTPAGAGWEIGYRTDDSLARAFAVAAGAGSVVVEWGGLDEEEHRSGLPAYVLARKSLARR